jgi:hypothetical protein
LSGPLPIFINYNFEHIDMTKSSLWRLRSALKNAIACAGSPFVDQALGLTDFSVQQIALSP